MPTSLPNLLTLLRIAVIPVLVGLFYVRSDLGDWLACGLFAFAALTDFLDGYLARTTRSVSTFGRVLDPLADKLLVATTLLMLVAVGRIDGLTVLPAVLILCRELVVSGLREFLAELNVGLPVSQLAKWKTTIQMIAIGALILGDTAPGWMNLAVIGDVGLWLAAALTLITGYDYLKAGIFHIRAAEKPAAESGP